MCFDEGDDPGTYNDHNEVQLLRCLGTDGTFTLSFRQQTSPPIPYNTSASQLKEILSSLKTLGPLSVYFTLNGNLPNNTQSIVKPSLPIIEGQPPNGYFTRTEEFIFSYNTTLSTTKNTTLCDSTGHQTVVIVFDTIHGSLPALIPDYSLLHDNSNNSTNIGSGSGSGLVQVFHAGAKLNGYSSFTGGSNFDI